MIDEKLIEELRQAIHGAIPGSGKYADYEKAREQGFDMLGDIARAVIPVFEKAHTPTDDEQEALAEIVCLALEHRDGGRECEVDYAVADAILAADFRRSEAPEPSAQVACPHWAEGKITMRKGCTACAAEGREPEPQGEPSDAQVAAARLSHRRTPGTDNDKMRAALRAAQEAQ